MTDESDLLGRIEAFIKATGSNPTDFGRAAINDRNLVKQLKKGRELRRNTRERVEKFMADNWPSGLKKTKTQQPLSVSKDLSASYKRSSKGLKKTNEAAA